MENPGTLIISDRDASSVRDFFNGWSLYRRIVDNDYLYHRSVREALSRWLDDLGRPFSFLDLGCGDADFSSGILRGRSLQSYTGIDLSPVALDLAHQKTSLLGVPCSLITGDFMHHPCQIAHPDWSTNADSDRAQGIQTRLRMFEQLAGTPTLVIGTHFAGATAGHIVRDGETYRLDVA